MATKSLDVLHAITNGVVGTCARVVTIFSFEWILTLTKRPNGGDIVFLRATLVAILFYLFSIAAKHGLDPARAGPFSGQALGAEIATSLEVFGAIFAAVYFALYARFSSQWTYLSNLYNKIKETEARTCTDDCSADIIAAWKADFLEDADDLHLATKRVFAPLLVAWAHDPAVKKCYLEHMSRDESSFAKLLDEVTAACKLRGE